MQAAGTAPISFTSTLLEPKQLTAEEEFDIKWSSASLYSGQSRRFHMHRSAYWSLLQPVPTRYVYVPLVKLNVQPKPYVRFQTVSAVNAFFLAMALYPAVQAKAQREIDALVGGDRLPTFADREDLPYVDALVKEVCRYSLVGTGQLIYRISGPALALRRSHR